MSLRSVISYPATKQSAGIGIGAPANTPPEIVEILNKEVNAALADAAFRGRLAALSLEPFAISASDLGKFIVEYTNKWSKVIRAAGIKAE